MLRKLILAMGAAIALSACSMGSVSSLPPAPVAVADTTILDEQAILAVELAYKASRLAVETAVDAGLIRGARATQVATLDNKAYRAVLAARSAYRTGNATSYANALTDAKATITAVIDLLQNKG